MPAREKILVALSGGVDSSVAALLLKRQGHDVAAAYMKNWINEDQVIGHCPWEQDIADARRVAEQIGIEFRVVNLMQRLPRARRRLPAGRLRPRPDAQSRRHVQPGDQVRRLPGLGPGPRLRRPGHRALRPAPRAAGRELRPARGRRQNKDQSYFLALLGQGQIRDARFPVGQLTKPEVRRLAREAGLANGRQKGQPGHLLHRRGEDGGLPARLRARARPGRSSGRPTAASWARTAACTSTPSASARASACRRTPTTSAMSWSASGPRTTPCWSPSTIPIRPGSTRRRSGCTRSAGPGRP